MVKKFTSQEISKLSQFRDRLSDLHLDKEKSDDYYLIRWLRARNLDLDKAEEMLRTSLKWRKENKADSILEDLKDEIPLRMKRIYPCASFGVDKEQNPVLFFPVGRSIYRIGIEEMGIEMMLKCNIYVMELIMKAIREKEEELGIRGIQIVEIADFEHYAFKEIVYKPSRDFVVETQRILQLNYPEILKSLLIINAPKLFAMGFNLVKPLMPKETLEKMDIYGGDEEVWKGVMRERFSPESIPVRWGGSLEGEDVFCSQDLNVWPDGPIPLEYFTQDIVDEYGFTKVKVPARNKIKVDVNILREGSELRWKFKTEGHDIGFQVSTPSSKTPVPWSRLDSHNFMQQGSINCGEVGGYQLLFDNSFSFTKSKLLKYYVEVVAPGEEALLRDCDYVDLD